MNHFVVHGCEQVLRFTQVKEWNDLSEAIRVQLGFNMGVVALGLELTNEQGVRRSVMQERAVFPWKIFEII